MTEQRSVVLAHLNAHLLALGGIRLGDVERDQPVVMAGEDMLAARRDAARIGKEIEREANLVAGIGLWPDRETERQQRIDRPLLRGFDPRPALAIADDREIRNDLVEDTGAAEALPFRHAPVAIALIDIGAGEDIVRPRQHEPRDVRIIEHRAAATEALGILEIEPLAAMRTGKELHRNVFRPKPERSSFMYAAQREAVSCGSAVPRQRVASARHCS